MTQVTGRKLNATILILLVLALGYFVADKFWIQPRLHPEPPTKDTAQPKAHSIAVLPFADMSPEGDNEYFSDGLTEELLNILSRISELRVAGRTSSFAFKGRNEDLRAIGEKLNVNTILEGSVRKDDRRNRVRITAQLVSAEDGYHLWSEVYDRELDDIFAIQEEIAHEVAKALRITLLVEANIDDFQPLQGVWHGEYRRAQLATLRSAHDAAIGFLERAFELGWRTYWRQYLVYDPVLSRLRGHPGFRKLVARFEADMERQREQAYALLDVEP
jgi:TolB-like protein